MKKNLSGGAVLIFIILISGACTKNTDPDGDQTIANISGIYQLTGFTKTIRDITYNSFDTMSVCRKDNLVRFNADMTVNFIDAGTPCSFATNTTGNWRLANGYLYMNKDTLRIINFNGKILALTAISSRDPGVVNFITWMKK